MEGGGKEREREREEKQGEGKGGDAKELLAEQASASRAMRNTVYLVDC